MENPPQDTNPAEVSEKVNSSGEAWTSEMQYVSSLAKLQKMEATVSLLALCVDLMFKLTSADPSTADSTLWASNGANSPHHQPQGGFEEAAAKIAACAL